MKKITIMDINETSIMDSSLIKVVKQSFAPSLTWANNAAIRDIANEAHMASPRIEGSHPTVDALPDTRFSCTETKREGASELRIIVELPMSSASDFAKIIGGAIAHAVAAIETHGDVNSQSETLSVMDGLIRRKVWPGTLYVHDFRCAISRPSELTARFTTTVQLIWVERGETGLLPAADPY